MQDKNNREETDYVCKKCGTVWITKGEPSEEGTQVCYRGVIVT